MTRLRDRSPRFAALAPTAARLAIYSLLCVAGLAWLVGFIGNINPFESRVSYSAVLEDASGLFVNDSVRVAGVPVGRVTGIRVEQGRAVVDFEVTADTAIPTDSMIGLRWRNVIGQRFLYVFPGTSSDIMPPGARLPLEQSISTAQVGDLLQAMGPVLRAVDPEDANAIIRAIHEAVDGQEATLRGLLADAGDIATTAGSMDVQVGRTITQFEQLVSALGDRSTDLDRLIRDLASAARVAADNDQAFLGLVDEFKALLHELETVVDGNRPNLDRITADLAHVARQLADRSDALEETLTTLPSGLLGYHEVSTHGQWFTLNNVVLCLAGQAECQFVDPQGNTTGPTWVHEATNGAAQGHDRGSNLLLRRPLGSWHPGDAR